MKTSLLNVIRESIPRSWQSNKAAHFIRKMYSLFYLLPYSTEYFHVAHDLLLDGYEPLWIKRIQNLTTFGRYLLRRQQLIASLGTKDIESVRYLCVPEESQYLVCQHNVDHRRYSFEKEERGMYETPGEAIIKAVKIKMQNPVLIVARVAGRSSATSRHDSEIYPEYIIKFVRKSPGGCVWGTKMTKKYHESLSVGDKESSASSHSDQHADGGSTSGHSKIPVARQPVAKEQPPTFGTFPKNPPYWAPKRGTTETRQGSRFKGPSRVLGARNLAQHLLADRNVKIIRGGPRSRRGVSRRSAMGRWKRK
jgi:hypothetical protein